MSQVEFSQVKNDWSDLTQTANNLFNEGKHNNATRLYQQALYLSEIMFRNENDATKFEIEIASPFFVSCLNLANNFWALKDLKNAGDYFLYNVWHLKILSNKSKNNSHLHFQSTKNWEKAVLSLLDFYEKTGQKLTVDFWLDETYAKITDTRKWLVNRQTYLN